MSRHVIDTPKPRDDAPRIREFLRVERESQAHPATLDLQTRPKARGTARIRQFLRIERDREA